MSIRAHSIFFEKQYFKGGITLELQERDIAIFRAIRQNRMLTISQIKRMFYPNVNSYHYRRLELLEKNKYITKRPLMETTNGKRIGKCIYLTAKGFKVIGEDFSNPHSLIELPKQNYRAALSELFVQQTPVGWKWHSSHEVKEKHGMDRNCRVAGSLTRPNPAIAKGEEEFLVYYFSSEHPLESTVNAVQSELGRGRSMRSVDLSNIIVLHVQPDTANQNLKYESTDSDDPEDMIEKFDRKNSRRKKKRTDVKKVTRYWTDHFGMYRLHLMRYNTAIEMLPLMVDPDYLINSPYFQSLLERLDINYLGTEYGLFSNHLVEHYNEKCYLVELYSNNLTTVHLLKNYNESQARDSGRRVIVLAPPEEEEYWNKTLRTDINSSYIRVYTEPLFPEKEDQSVVCSD